MRFLLDSYGLPFTVLHPAEIETADLSRFDVVLLPGGDRELLLSGRRKRGERVSLPDVVPEMRRGMGPKGLKKLFAFAEGGGVVVACGGATGLFLGLQEAERGKDLTEAFQLPVEDVSEALAKAGLDVTGSWLRVDVRPDHPLTWGMPPEAGVFSRGRPLFRTSVPGMDMDRRVIAWHPEGPVLLSGFAEHEELLGRTVAAAWVRKGKGQFVLFGFAPHFRASTPATYKLLFNALLLPRL